MRRIFCGARQTVTRATSGVLYYLRRYLEKTPDRRTALRAYFKEKTGRTLYQPNLTRHLGRQELPNMDAALVYLSFLHREGQLIPGAVGSGALFIYAQPALLKAPAVSARARIGRRRSVGGSPE